MGALLNMHLTGFSSALKSLVWPDFWFNFVDLFLGKRSDKAKVILGFRNASIRSKDMENEGPEPKYKDF
jgi:hypothetical protein